MLLREREPVSTPVGPDPDLLIEEARRRGRRRHMAWAALGLALLASAAAGAAWAFHASSPPSLTVSEIAAREAAALKHGDHLVVRMTVTNFRQGTDIRIAHSVEWADLAKLQTRTILAYSGATPNAQTTQVVTRYFTRGAFVAGEVTTGEAWYGSRTWITYDVSHLPEGPGYSRQPLSAFTETIPEAVLQANAPGSGPLAVLSANVIGRTFLGPSPSPWLYQLVGGAQINGHPAVELQTRWPRRDLALVASHGTGQLLPARDARFDVWISEASYLPVREQLSWGTHPGWTEDLAWLPATKANLTLLKLKAPHGFTHSVVKCNKDDTGCSFGLFG